MDQHRRLAVLAGAAAHAVDQLDPGLARERSAAILKRDDLHAESRRALAEYLG
ncbi:MAG: hypothetical protein GY719_01255 [bacterium]|nr:hypothetical protein [bacterium]